MKKEACLSIIEDEKSSRVLMIRHKRGINEGYLNFPGGKKDPDETMLQCVVRETMEETGIKILNPIEVGYIEFAGKEFYVHVFRSTMFEGDVVASEGEVDVFWQDKDKIPYDKMRTADADFVPVIMAGNMVRRRYYYDADFNVEKIEDLNDTV